MRKRILTVAITLSVAICAGVLAGCGSRDAEAPATLEQSGMPATMDQAAEPAVAVHDCAGGCGMTSVPQDQLTEIDGKWYCAGCAKRLQDEDAGPGDG